MAAKLRPHEMLPRSVSSTAARAAEARGRQLQRLVGRPARVPSAGPPREPPVNAREDHRWRTTEDESGKGRVPESD